MSINSIFARITSLNQRSNRKPEITFEQVESLAEKKGLRIFSCGKLHQYSVSTDRWGDNKIIDRVYLDEAYKAIKSYKKKK